MQFKLRPVPFIISIAISATALFGGWFLYHSYAMETPLDELVGQQAGVASVTTDITNKDVTVHLELTPEASLRDIYAAITSGEKSMIGDRTVKLNIQNEASDILEDVWASMLFEIAEVMENKQYSQIPAILNSAHETNPTIQISAEMDETYVYIKLVKKQQSKFVVLPRVSDMGVWPNE